MKLAIGCLTPYTEILLIAKELAQSIGWKPVLKCVPKGQSLCVPCKVPPCAIYRARLCVAPLCAPCPYICCLFRYVHTQRLMLIRSVHTPPTPDSSSAPSLSALYEPPCTVVNVCSMSMRSHALHHWQVVGLCPALNWPDADTLCSYDRPLQIRVEPPGWQLCMSRHVQ